MYIQSLKLENVKAFDSLDLDFSRPEGSTYAGMNVFVGGNSSGKSTLLKCIAMALSGPTIANQQLISPAGWIRGSETRGRIEINIRRDPVYDLLRSKGAPPADDQFPAGLVFESENSSDSITLKAREYRNARDSRVQTAERGPWNADATGWFLSGYGPLRRLTGSSTEALRYALGAGKLASCVTLFREDAALSESETWLKQEHARSLEQQNQGRSPSSLVDQVRAFLNDGLLPSGFFIARVSVDHVYMATPNGGELPMRDLSDGCRGAFALMLDIIHNMAMAYRDHNIFSRDANGLTIVNRPGVILIDEIEAHLHPSWQRLICEWLKTRFPLIQFFITTHSPLIAQSASEGGLYVLPLPSEISQGQKVRRLERHEQERVSLGRAEKVLLGEAFGLKQTWSRQAETIVARWQTLTAKRHSSVGLSIKEQTELGKLTKQVEIVFDDDVHEGANA